MRRREFIMLVGGVALSLGFRAGAHVGGDVAVRQRQVIEAAAGLRLAIVVPLGDLQHLCGSRLSQRKSIVRSFAKA